LSDVIVYSVVSLTALGALFGLGLAIAARKFAVKQDPRVAEVEALLPGANCGGCGYAGCHAFARALVAGIVSPYDCAPGGSDGAGAIAQVLGLETEERVPVVAVVACKGGNRVEVLMDYQGLESCKAVTLLSDNLRVCPYGCIGLGDCVTACPFDAIHMENGFAVVDEAKCTGCGTCVEVCPKGIISLVARPQKVRVVCSSHDKGKSVKSICEVGCIACGLCAKNCPVKCIEIVNNLAVIDHEKCTNCGICAAKCPTNSIADQVAARPKAFIGTSCTGCGDCVKVCPFKAIEGEEGKKHSVIHEKCIGCGLCRDVCKENAVTIAGALGHLPED
jgi:electron transport complex protein RnfB